MCGLRNLFITNIYYYFITYISYTMQNLNLNPGADAPHVLTAEFTPNHLFLNAAYIPLKWLHDTMGVYII